MEWLATRAGRPSSVIRCSDPVLSDGEGAFWTATPANHRGGGQLPGDGNAQLAGTELFHPVPQAKVIGCSDFSPPQIGAVEPSGRQHWNQASW